MFVEFGAGSAGSPIEPWCKGCRLPIASREPTEILEFPADPEYRLERMNGLYHARCAQPLTSIARALEALNRCAMGR